MSTPQSSGTTSFRVPVPAANSMSMTLRSVLTSRKSSSRRTPAGSQRRVSGLPGRHQLGLRLSGFECFHRTDQRTRGLERSSALASVDRMAVVNLDFPVLHLSRSIDRSPAEVTHFAGDPANLPTWAAELSARIREVEGRWIADSPLGSVEVRFLPGPNFGTLDHEVVFTLFRRPGTSKDEFDRDTTFVREDLLRLRDALAG